MSSPLEPVRAALRRMTMRARYQAVFGTPEGQHVLHDLLREAGVLQSSHVPGDPYDTAHLEGRRSQGLYIIDMLRWSEAELRKLAELRTTQQLQEGEV